MTKKIPLLVGLFIYSFDVLAVNLLTGQESLEFHGYFRGGLGLSQSGTNQARFQAPGTRAAYRLGNEPDTNLQLTLKYNYDINQPENENSHVQGIVMLDAYKAHGESNDLAVDKLAQAYLSFNAFFDSESKIWLGRRYYDRKNIHIADHFWLNAGQNSQAGTGIEDVALATGKLNIALFRYEDDFEISGTAYLINSTALDFRWHGLAVTPESKLTLWGGVKTRHDQASLGYSSETGYGFGGWLDHETKNIKNTIVLIYQSGAAITQSDFNPNPVREDLGWNLEEASALEINNTLSYEILPEYSVQWAVILRQENRDQGSNAKLNWYSTGVRPIFYFSKHINLALEAGVDYVDDEINNRSGTVNKLTTALQISAERGLYSRPVLRIFATYASWNDEFMGLVATTPGDAPYANETDGWSIGAQTEVWW